MAGPTQDERSLVKSPVSPITTPLLCDPKEKTAQTSSGMELITVRFVIWDTYDQTQRQSRK
jgi:hypothetical protein